MRLVRTFDAQVVRSIIEHPGVRSETWDQDGEIPIPMHSSIYYLVPIIERFADGMVEDVKIGVVAFMPVNPITWNPHIAILPGHRGTGTMALKMAMSWMFTNTPCLKIVAYPPEFNERMIRVFEKCGYDVEGRSMNSFPWRGRIYDRVLMGTDKEKHLCGPLQP